MGRDNPKWVAKPFQVGREKDHEKTLQTSLPLFHNVLLPLEGVAKPDPRRLRTSVLVFPLSGIRLGYTHTHTY